MKNPMTRSQIWRRAARAFENRNRNALSVEEVRQPEPGETPLSRSEIAFGIREGLISTHQLRAEKDAPQGVAL